jgi:HSP20 family molecular chaperone IbpA
MRTQTATGLAPLSEIRQLSVGDPFFERVQEINDLIARRAYELFESSGFTHDHDLEDWLRAESAILHPIPLEVTETENELTVLAEVPGFSEKDLEVRVEPRCLFITGKRQESSERKEGKTIYSERHSKQIFRVLDLPARVDPEGVKATLSDGLLEVRLSKAVAGKQIPVLAKAASA